MNDATIINGSWGKGDLLHANATRGFYTSDGDTPFIPARVDGSGLCANDELITNNIGVPISGDSGIEYEDLFVHNLGEYEIKHDYKIASDLDCGVQLDIAGYALTGNMGGCWSAYGIDFSPDGVYLIVSRGNTLRRWTLTTPWDVTTLTDGIQTNPPYRTIGYMGFSPDGTKMIGTHNSASTDYIVEFSLSTPWDITTLSRVREVVVTLSNGTLGCATLSKDGHHLYIHSHVHLESFYLPNAFSVVGFVPVSSVLDWDLFYYDCISISCDGRRLFTSHYTDDYINTFTLTTPWDITTLADRTQSLYARNIGTRRRAIYMRNNGEQLFITNDSGNIYEYQNPDFNPSSLPTNILDQITVIVEGVDHILPYTTDLNDKPYYRVDDNNRVFYDNGNWIVFIDGIGRPSENSHHSIYPPKHNHGLTEISYSSNWIDDNGDLIGRDGVNFSNTINLDNKELITRTEMTGGGCAIKEVITYDQSMVETNSWYNKSLKYIGEDCPAPHIEPLQDVNGELIYDSNGELIFVQPE